jgi:lipoprotein-releasing system permease protein
LNFAYYYARRITFKQQRSVSALVVKLAVISIAISVAVMEISLSVVQGFETKIQDKVVGFGSHIQIGNYFSMDEEEIPIPIDTSFMDQVKTLQEVVSISPYVLKWSILSTPDYKGGVVMKGVDSTFDWRFFESCLVDGRLPDYKQEKASLEVMISKIQARQLALKIDEKARAYFFEDPLRMRRVKIVGIYETGMEEFDNNLVICDLRMLQKIRRWKSGEVTGFEINLRSLEKLDVTADSINQMSINYAVYPITRLYPEIFEWLNLQHQNVDFIVLLMIIVAVINMTSVILILIIERTRDIGILKALGLKNFKVQLMFMWNAFFLILVGVIIGNILGLGLLYLQSEFGLIEVNQENYFIKTVPVAWVWGKFLNVNLLVISICTLFTLIPALVTARITPIRAIRFQ